MADTQSPTSSTSSLFSFLIAWCFIILLAVLAIAELKAPDSVPATAPQTEFSAERALIHVRAMAAVPHPIGSSANDAVREYLLAQLSGLGMNPQVFRATGIYNGNRAVIAGDTRDIVGRLPGTANSQAIMLMAHYDSVPTAPGAADDVSGVAAILEAVRALRAGPPLKNDLIVLLTDGEEAGLLGAEAFVANNPLLKDIGLVLNFEARGDRGPSMLFETSSNNAALIKEVARSAPYPVGSSLFYSIYKLLPNDTAFTVFRPAATPGLNFAFGGRLEAYHSGLDTPDNLSTESLQHHGSYALALARGFGQMDVSQLKQRNGDDVFFDWFGSSLITYSQKWVIPVEILASILLVLTILISTRRPEVRMGRIFLALLPSLGILLAMPVLLAAAGWLLLGRLPGEMTIGDTPANSWELTGLVLFAAGIGSTLFAMFRKRFTLQELGLAGLIIVCICSWAFALLLPAGSYLLLWPLLITTLGFLIIEAIGKASSVTQWVATLPGAAITILLFAPLAYLLYIFLTLQWITMAAIGLLLGLFFIACIPLVNVAVPQRRGRALTWILVLGGIIVLAVGVTKSHSSPEHPHRDGLIYSLNADDHTARWICLDRALDSWTSQFIANKPQPQPAPNYLAGAQRPVFSATASPGNLLPPVADIKADEKQGDVRNIRMTVKSQRNVNRIVLRLVGNVQPISFKISGRQITPRQSSPGYAIILYGMGSEPVDLELALKAPSGVSFWLTDYSEGLPETHPRSANILAEQGSDETIVVRKYSL